jgi:hypothetical protein
MRVLYIGVSDPASTTRHRADAMHRLGAQVIHLDPLQAMGARLHGWSGRVHYRSGYLLLARAMQVWLRAELQRIHDVDLIWVDSGELLSAGTLRMLRAAGVPIVLFNHDDPTGTRDWLRFMGMRAAIPFYDLCIVVREANVAEYQRHGARAVLRNWMTYDEVRHQVDNPERAVPAHLQSDVAFIGGNHKGEGRDLFLLHLIDAGLNPAIWGDGWERSAQWARLKPHWRGPSVAGQDYVDTLRGAKLCLGFLSKANRDQHTTRTMEIPAAGGLLCAKRTDEHMALYREGEEAVFWSGPEECVQRCRELLGQPERRERIRLAGRARLLRNQCGNEDLVRRAWQHLGLIAPARQRA